MFFEKKRLFDGEIEVTEMRKRQMKAFPRGRDLLRRRGEVWFGADEEASFDELGRLVITRTGCRDF